MSLQGKIIAWFVVFASLTALLVGMGDYYQSSRALRSVLAARAGSLALIVAGEVERRYDRAERELLALGYAAAGAPADSQLQSPPGFTHVRVSRDGSILREFSSAPPAAAGCAAGAVQFEVALPAGRNGGVRVEAAMPAGFFFAGVPAAGVRLGRRGMVAVMRPDGALVFDAACSISSAGDPGLLGAAVSSHVRLRAPSEPNRTVIVDLSEGHEQLRDDRFLALARSANPAWAIVIGVDYGQFAAPFIALVLRFAVSTLGLLLLVVVVVLLGLRRDMRRLASLAAAANAIGHGHFDVWLPPPTSDEVGRLSLALGRMLDRLRTTLQQIEVARSMAAVGELATYLSHEVRNPISSIRLNLQMLRRDLASGTPPDDGPELVGLCLTELQRLEHVVSTVLEVGRPAQRGVRNVCEAHTVVHDTLRVMQRNLRDHGIEVVTRLEAPESQVTMNAAGLHSVIMNLLLNSIDALRDTESKQIEIGSDLYDDERTRRFGLRIRDSGPGVPPEIRNRIFDPFFTTKSTGTGIGLPTALRAVREAGGALYYGESSEWRGGAEFIIELPLSPALAQVPSPKSLPIEPLVGAGAA